MKRKLFLLVAVVLLFAELAAPTAQAARVFSVENEVETVRAGNYLFSKPIRRLNSLDGIMASTSVYSGSCSGSERHITSVRVFCNVSWGSSPYILEITSPGGTIVSRWCGTSTTSYNFSDFDGEDPRGNWTVSITTRGRVTTMSGSLTVNYTFQ